MAIFSHLFILEFRTFQGSDAHQKIEIEPLEQTYLGVAQALFSDIMDKEEL